MPLALFLVGAGTFALVGFAGLSVIDRYLLVPSLCVMVFAAVFIGGWTMLEPGSGWRRAWMTGAAAVVVFGIVFTATRVNLVQLRNELQFRGDSHVALEQVLHDPAVTRALRCGPVYVPNHKLIPDVRWILDRPKSGVLARSNVRSKRNPAPPPARGVVHPRPQPPRALQAGVRDPRRRNRRQPAARRLRPRRHEPVLRRLCQLLSAFGRERLIWGAAVAGLLLLAFLLRIWGNSHGLPYAYNADENAHFVTRAIGLFGHDWDPNYYINPPAYTYLVHVVLGVWYGGRAGVSNSFAADPTQIWIIARTVAAVLGTIAVWLLYLAGARLVDRRVGLLCGRHLRRRVPAGLLLQARAQRRADARRRLPRACGAPPGSCATGACATTSWPGSGSAWRARRSTPAGSCCCRSSPRRARSSRRAAAARARCAGSSSSASRRSRRSSSPTPTRCWTSRRSGTG